MVYRINDYTNLENLVHKYEVDGTFSTPDWQKKAKVSVIVTTYNQEDQLRKQLLALSQQTYDPGNFEVVVVDDGGKRGTGSSLDYVAQHNFPFSVKYVWQPDKGFRLAKARNEALKRATHETIISIDSDMIMNHTYVEDVMKWQYAAKQVGAKLVTIQDRAFVESEDMTESAIREKKLSRVKLSPSRRFGGKEDWRKSHYERTERLKQIPASIQDPGYFIGSMISGGNCSFSKADAFEIGLFDEDFQQYGAEDTEFGIRMYDYFNNKLGERLFFVPVDTTAYHIEHGSPMSAQSNGTSQELFYKKVHEARVRTVPPRPEISVYLPTFNKEGFIEKAIDSIAKQRDFDVSKLEVIVGEDGSTDRTQEILQDVQRKYQGKLLIRVINDGKNHGMAENTNRTIRACRGKYILQLDPDDELLPTAVRTLYDALEKDSRSSLAFGDCIDRDVKTGATKLHWSCTEYTPEWYKQLGERATREHIIGNLRAGMRIHPARMFRRSHFFRTEGVTPSLENAVDYDFSMKLVEVGIPRHVKRATYVYNYNHGGNTSAAGALQKANGQMVQKTSLNREKGYRKEMYIVDENTNRTRYFDLNNPTLRVESLREAWENDDKGNTKTASYRALKEELELLVGFFRWVRPEVARTQLEYLRQLDHSNSIGNYYLATFLESEGRPSEALKIIQMVGGSSARSLEARIRSALRKAQ